MLRGREVCKREGIYIYIYIYSSFTMYSRKQYNTIKQIYANKL